MTQYVKATGYLVGLVLVVGCYEREGDFQISMSHASQGQSAVELEASRSFRLEMRAHEDGSLRTMRLDETPLGVEMATPDERSAALDQLQQELIRRLQDRGDADIAELVFAADDNLDYEYIGRAVEKVTLAEDGSMLVEVFRFETSP